MWVHATTVISDQVLMSSFCLRCSTQFWERLEPTFRHTAYVAWSFFAKFILINASLVYFVLLFLFPYHMKWQQKLSSFFTHLFSFFGLDKDGKAGEVSLISQPPELQDPKALSSTSNILCGWCQNFNIIVWPRPCLKWPNLKCHVGHDPLWLISRLNTVKKRNRWSLSRKE